MDELDVGGPAELGICRDGAGDRGGQSVLEAFQCK